MKALFFKFYLVFIASIVIFTLCVLGLNYAQQKQISRIQANVETSMDIKTYIKVWPTPVPFSQIKQLVNEFKTGSKKNICVLNPDYSKAYCPGPVGKLLHHAKKLKDGERYIIKGAMILGPFHVDSDRGPLKMFYWKSRRNFSGRNILRFFRGYENLSIIALAILLCAIPWLYVSYAFFKPLSRLSIAIEAMAKGQFDSVINVNDKERSDVIGNLARVLDTMQSAMNQTHEANKNLVTRVAHEIHTPLTRIKLACGLILRKSQGQNLDNHLDSIEDDCDLLARISNELMNLSRISSGRSNSEFSEVHLNKIINQVSKEFENLFKQRGLALEIEISEGLVVKGYEKELTLLFTNLFQNAYKYADEHSLVRITNVKSNDQQLIEMVNRTSTPLPHGDVFEPFVHSAQKHDSHGLGLSFVKQVMNMHKGKANCSLTNGGFCMSLRFCYQHF